MKRRPRVIQSVKETTTAPLRPRSRLVSGVVVALVLLVTAPAVKNDFVNLDDALYLDSPAVRSGVTSPGVAFALTSVSVLYWHPLTWLSHEFDTEVFGANQVGHHFTNILLHAMSAGFLFLILTRFRVSAWVAVAGSLLWAIHPLRVESFAWIAERKDVLCAFFFTAAILAYLRWHERRSSVRYAIGTCLGICALMSKPTAVCLVPILLLLDYWPLRRRGGVLHRLIEKIPLILMTVLVVILTIYGQQRSGSMSHLRDVPFTIRLENTPGFLIRYISKILWPVSLSCFYTYNKHPAAVAAALSLLTLGVLTAGVVWQRKRRPWLLVGWIWFIIALLPNLGLLQAGRQSIADRFTHLAAMGLAIPIAMGISEWIRNEPLRKRIAGGGVCCVLALLGFLSWRQIGYWHDSVILFTHALSVEDNDYMEGNLASTLLRENRFGEAEPHLRMALRLAPDVAEYHNNFANILMRSGRLEQAKSEALVALQLAPNEIPGAETMGLILLRQADYGGALAQFDHAVKLGADPVPVAVELSDGGASAASHGNPQDAEPLLRRAVALDPSLAQARRNLALVLLDEGRDDDARNSLQEAIRETGPLALYQDLLPK